MPYKAERPERYKKDSRQRAVFFAMLCCYAAGGCHFTALKLMSRLLTEWVSAPTDMKSTPQSA